MTASTKQTLLPDTDGMERRFRRMFESFPSLSVFGPSVTPAADVYETPKEFVVELEVPGYEERDLHLEVSDHTLTISGAREESKDESKKTFRLQERLERTFERTFTLPPEVDGEHVTAQFDKGVLKVHAEKNTTGTSRKIEISSKA